MILNFKVWASVVLIATGVLADQGFYREVYFNIAGSAVTDLTGAAKFPDAPDEEQIVNSIFETPTNIAENYGQRLRAYITPQVSGSYTFYIATDDGSELWLSTNDQPAGKIRIAWVNSWTGVRVWTKEANQKSAAISLSAGTRYYVEVLHKEGSGGDNVAVGWIPPGESAISVIPAAVLSAYIVLPEIKTQPQPVEVFEQNAGVAVVSFTVEATRPAGITYQWQMDGVDIPGAEGSTYSLTADTANSNKLFRCVLSSAVGSVTSDAVGYSIIPDTVAPALLSIRSFHDPRRLTLRFSEPLEAISANAASNYIVSGSSVLSAQLIEEYDAVVLTLEGALAAGVPVMISFSVTDRAEPANTLTVSAYSYTPPLVAAAPVDLVRGIREMDGPSSRRTQISISEIHHTPAARTDGRDLRFVELHNSEPFFLDLSGYVISGAFNYTIPSGTIIPAKGYLVLAPLPADITALYGIANVIGGFDGAALNAFATITIHDAIGGWLTTVICSDSPPWPVAACGTGHSLVLARPSLGEIYPEAWSASAALGGSPGVAEPLSSHGFEAVVLNEVLAHPGGGDGFVEFYNFSASAVDLTGCALKADDPAAGGYVLPPGSIVPARGHLAFTETQLGYLINGRGDALWLTAPPAAGSVVIDALRFDDQEAGVALGRFPDGSGLWNRLQSPTAGAANSARRVAEVVLNEIMYQSLREKRNDEFVELRNTTTNAIALNGWKLSGDIAYTFTTESIAAGGYLVIPRDPASFTVLYPAISDRTAVGYSGALPNKRGTVKLERPAFVMDTNDLGGPVVKEKCVLIESVTYRDGGAWHKNADGLGSSLERVDPRADPALAASWQASDETATSDWVTLEFTGVIDLGFGGSNGDPNEVHIGLMGRGECLIDSVEVYEAGGANLVNNSSFEADTLDWRYMGTHDSSAIVVDAGAFDGARVLHLKAADQLLTGGNCVRGAMSRTMAKSGTGTIRACARWLSGMPELLVRTRGNWLEAPGSIVTTFAMGTPGAANSRAAANAAPSITEVIHQPLLPRNGEAVTVYARVEDSDGLLDAALHYRVDGVPGAYTVSMTPCTAGLLKGVIPAGQPANALIAFYVAASDQGSPVKQATYPASAPVRECLVRFNEPLDSRNFGIYRFWLTQANYSYWQNREAGSNKPVDITFLYNNRPVYEAGIMYAGSPFHSNYSAPINSGNIDYKIVFEEDDEVMNSSRMIIATLGNLGSDDVGIKEQFNYELVKAQGLPHPRRRFIHLYANGTEQNPKRILEDTEKPNKAYVERWFEDDPDRDFFKIDDWFEYTLDLEAQSNINATLQPFRTPAPDGDGTVLKLGRYRWNWQKRGAENFQNNNFTNLFTLVEGLNVADSATYTARIQELVNLERFAGVIAMNHFIDNWDTYGFNRGKNMYLYNALDGWSLIAWDLDFNFGNLTTTMNPNNGAFPVNDPTMRRLLQNPAVTRAYWRAVQQVMAASQSSAVRSSIRARYDALRADNTVLNGSYENHFTLVDQRYTYVANELNSINPANFTVTAPAAAISSSSANVMSVNGIAPFQAVAIRVNGVETPVTWTTVTGWSLEIVLNNGTNAFAFSAVDRDGAAVGGSVARQIVYTGPLLDSMEDFLVISEIMTLPVTNDAEYVELYNRSQTTVMNLAGVYVEGSVAFTFPPGVTLNPGECVLLVEDVDVFFTVYPGVDPARVAGKYSGRLRPEGGTVILKRPAAGFELSDVVLDRVDYRSGYPWPEIPAPGVALQLINPAIDSGRPANWSAAAVSTTPVTNTVTEWSAAWRYYTAGDPGTTWNSTNFNDSAWPSGNGPLGWETGTVLPIPLATTFPLTGRLAYYFRTAFTYSGNPATATLLLSYMLDDGAVFYLNGSEIRRSALMPLGPVTDATAATRAKEPEGQIEGPFAISSALLRAGENTLAVSVHQNVTGSSDLVFGMKLEIAGFGVQASSPGTVNTTGTSLEQLPEVWLNEIQTQNITGPVDDESEHEPWVELYNSGAAAVALAGWRLTPAESHPGWSFPPGTEIAAGGYLRVWLDGEVPAIPDPAHLHTSFRFDSPTGVLILLNADALPVDDLVFDSLASDMPYGCWPDGNFSARRNLNPPTPGAANRVDKRPLSVVINELMADNGVFTNPLSGKKDDWFELFNDGLDEADLSGYIVTDTLVSSAPALPDMRITKALVIPEGIRLAPGEALRIWTGADNAPSLPYDPENLQAPFGLGKSGDAIYLFNAATALVNSVVFAKEDKANESLGRWVNGAAGGWVFFDAPTPGVPNRNPLFGAGYINQPAAARIDEGQYFALTNTFIDLRPSGFEFRLFSAEGAALPEGLLFNPISGVLQWTPSEAQGPGLYEFDLVGYLVDGFTVTACDHLLLTICVDERPSVPVLTPVPPIAVNEGAVVAFTCEVLRSEEIPYYETFTHLRLEGDVPSNAVFNGQTGAFVWQTGEIDGPGVYYIKVVAEDSVRPEVRCEMVVTVSVAEVNSTFTLASPTKFYLWNNEPFAVGLKLNDPDLPPNIFSYALLSGPAGCTLDFNTGVLQWQPAVGYAGNQSVSFRAFDNAGAARNFTLTLYVSALVLTTQSVAVQPDGAVRLEWASKLDTYYIVEWSPSLTEPLWQSVNPDQPVAGTGSAVGYTVTPSAVGSPEKAFFRVMQYR